MSAKPQMYSGFHAVTALLHNRPEAVLELFVLEARAERGDERLEALVADARAQGVSVQRCRKEALAKHAGPQNQGVVARARPRQPGDERALLDCVATMGPSGRILLLDGVTDPHNLGACLRTADAAGVTAVAVPRRQACGLTPVACRTAAGAAESLPYFEVGSLVRLLADMAAAGVTIVGTDLGDDSVGLFDYTPQGPQAIVMGSEGTGMRPKVREACQVLVEIPMRGQVQSLNVSVATAVVLYRLCAG